VLASCFEELSALMVDDPSPVVALEQWRGTWAEDDPDANFKSEVAEYTRLDPLVTVDGLSRHTGIPVGSLVRYVLARWATAGSGGLLEVGPEMVQRLWAPMEAAELDDSDAARLAAYHQVRQMLSWLKAPLDRPEYYDI
jgi:hypothetical protein